MFDINSPEALFFHVRSTMERYSSSRAKKISDLFFLIMALNHLREWIAPGYKKNGDNWPSPKNNAERFSKKIYEQSEFDTIRELCNGTKHLSVTKAVSTASYGLNLGDWDSLRDVKSLRDGPPSGFYVGGKNIEDLLRTVIASYAADWFDVVSPP